MKTKRILVALPAPLKAKLDALRAQGYTAAGQDMKAVGQWIVDSLLKSQVGAAADSVHQRMVDLGGWTSDVEIRIREFEKLRRTGELPDRVKKEVT